MIKAEKIDKYNIRITETKEVVTVQDYDVNFLHSQKKGIQVQKDAFDAARDREIADIDALLKHCEKESIVIKPLEIEDIIKPAPDEVLKSKK